MLEKLRNRIEKSVKITYVRDAVALAGLRVRRRLWPCLDPKYLLVGCESSGTTPISHLLLRNGKARFLLEGINSWVWDLYMSVYQGHTSVRDYPRLLVYDRIKVPGFAAILPQFMEQFPNTRVVYVVRDPRDVVASACRTFRLKSREELSGIPWVAETWLGITESDPVARLAIRWRMYLEKSQQVPGVKFVRYEDFYADRPGFISSLAAELKLVINEDQVRRRCNRQASEGTARNYHPKGPGSWRNSLLTDHDIVVIESICGESMARWGYVS